MVGGGGQWEIVREILKHHDVDVNAEGTQGNTALYWASLRGQLDVVRDMLNHEKVDVHYKNTKLDLRFLTLLANVSCLISPCCLEKHTKHSSRSLEHRASMRQVRKSKAVM
jgi:ankyrin repeat protein